MRGKPHNFLTPDPPACPHSLNTAMSTYPNTLEPLLGPNLQSILLELEEKFPPVTPHPKEEIAPIMYKAGQRSVIEWLKNRLEE